MRTTRQQAGDAAEDLVARRLEAAGWTILARRLRVGRGELDIVAVDPASPGSLVIVEVRWRASREFGLAEETLEWRKRRHLLRAAMGLIERGLADGRPLPHLPLRFDLVVVEPPMAGSSAIKIRHHRYVVHG